MKKFILVLALVFCATLFANAKAPKIEGTWKMVSNNGEPMPFQYTKIALITPTHFIWTLYDKHGNMLNGAGGTWEMKGDTYTETIEMVLPGMRNFYGEKHVETVKFEGDRMIKVFKENGTGYSEIWERVK